MKINFYVIIIFIILCAACSPQMTPLRGSYEVSPFQVISEKQIDTIWSNIIDLFATKGLSIKVIDKNSGLIVSEKTSLISNYTFEDDRGKLLNTNAWVVINRIQWMGSNVTPERLTGEWNVRIKPYAGGKTAINVNLTNIEGTRHYAKADYSPEQNFVFEGHSTGKFEQTIADIIK